MLPLSLLALAMASPALAQTAGSIVEAGDTLVSAMMMFLGNEEKVYIMDKAENNAQTINGHPAWASVWDISTKTATLMDFASNAFCASGMHFPNGSFATFGGNGAIGPGGNIGSQVNAGGGSGAYDDTYKDADGAKSIRILNPCSGSVSAWASDCQWFDDASKLAMQKKRWYSTAEALADGSIVLIGGFVNGGYINRNFPDHDPNSGAAENTYEYYPSKGDAKEMQLMLNTGGLNSYAHAFLMPSGKMLVQTNYTTILWDHEANIETPLPDMPGKVIRTYPASGATAMLPLTPKNLYTPTVLFCGGNDMPDEAWGNYSWPWIDTWNKPASKDCQRITPEPIDGSAPAYEQDDDMLEGRTMGQFITLPTGKMLVLNGGVNGTAGYSTQTLLTTSYSDMPFGMSLASGPVGTPALYDPDAAKGSRWTNAGFGSSTIPRLYHSSALLLPDASVLIAGSNPNVDVNTSTIFPTTYKAEIFYPPYFAAKTRPTPSGIPTSISYGGDSFDVTVPASSYSGSANDAADNTTVVLVRPGWTTHAMNMGQRFLQLNSTYTVNTDGSIVLHVAQAPPNANLLTPGPVLFFVVVNGIPSKGKMVTVGNGLIGVQPLGKVAELPASVRLDNVDGSASGGDTDSGGDTGSGSGAGGSSSGSSSNMGAIVGGIVAAVAVVGIIGALVGIGIARRRRAARATSSSSAYAMTSTAGAAGALYGAGAGGGGKGAPYGVRHSNSSAFMPLQTNASAISLGGPPQAYRDDGASSLYGSDGGADHVPPHAGAGGGQYAGAYDHDPYYANSRMR